MAKERAPRPSAPSVGTKEVVEQMLQESQTPQQESKSPEEVGTPEMTARAIEQGWGPSASDAREKTKSVKKRAAKPKTSTRKSQELVEETPEEDADVEEVKKPSTSRRSANQATKQGKKSASGQTRGDDSPVTIDNSRTTTKGERNTVIRAEGNSRIKVDNSVNIQGIPLTPQIDVPVELMKGDALRASVSLAPNPPTTPAKEPGVENRHREMTGEDLGTFKKGPAQPAAPAVGTAPVAPSAPVVGTSPAQPAAPATVKAPGELREDFKKWFEEDLKKTRRTTRSVNKSHMDAKPTFTKSDVHGTEKTKVDKKTVPINIFPKDETLSVLEKKNQMGKSVTFPDVHTIEKTGKKGTRIPVNLFEKVGALSGTSLLTPAQTKKFEGLLKNKEDLAEINALTDALAAAHIKEASFSTLRSRMLGWVSGSHRTNKKEAIAARAAALEAWQERLRAHANNVYGQVEKLSAKNQARQVRYRGLMTQKLVLSQMKVLEQKKAELMPPNEKWLIRKAVESYGKLSPWKKAAASSLLVTGGMIATGGLAGMGAITMYGAYRFARTGAAIAGGAYASKKIGQAARLMLRWTAGLKGKDTRRSVAGKQIAAEARKGAGSGALDKMEVGRAFDLYKNAVDKERRDDLIVLATAAAAGFAVGGAAGLTSSIDGNFVRSQIGDFKTPITPDIPVQETVGMGPQNLGGTRPSSPPEWRGPVDERDLENPAQRDGASKMPAGPAEKSAPGKGAAPTPTPKTPPHSGPSIGGTIDDIGVDEKPAPGKGAGPNKPAVPAPTETPSKLFEGPVAVQPGDTVWGMLEKAFGDDPRFAAFDRAQKDFVLDSYKVQLKEMGVAELKKMGFRTADINKIYAGQSLDLSKIASDPALSDKIAAQADALTREQRINILKHRGLGAEALLERRPATPSIPGYTPVAPQSPAVPTSVPHAPSTPTPVTQVPPPPAPSTAASPAPEVVPVSDNRSLNEIDAEADESAARMGEAIPEKLDTGETLAPENRFPNEIDAEADESAARTGETIPEKLDTGETPAPENRFPNQIDAESGESAARTGEPVPERLDTGEVSASETRSQNEIDAEADESAARMGESVPEKLNTEEAPSSAEVELPQKLDQAPAPQDYSIYTGNAPTYNPEAYGGLTEAQLEGMARTQLLTTISDYFGTRGLFFTRNDGMSTFESIGWKEADAFIRDAKLEPESIAEGLKMTPSKLTAFVEFLEQGAQTYNVPIKNHRLDAVLESVVKHGVERSVANTVLP